ncbi:MAG: restriction endonuclease subunit S, partial [Tetragenococcus koreensis]|nr:restriction endonuclease subunit S [Tetragenococcus koreensis]
MSKKNNLYPKLRFKEFTKSWKKKKISSIANSFDTDRVPVTAKDRVEGSTPYYGANGIQDYVQGFTHEGEFVLLAEDGANDLKNYPVHYVNRQIWVNNHAHVLQGDSQILNNIFLKYSLKTIDMKPHLVGGGRAKLNANAMMNINIFLSDLAEQEKIGNFFKKIDEMIQLRKTKVDKMKDIKTAYLSEMFPKKGEKYPKKRFKGFTKSWKKKKISSIANSFD